MTDPIIMKQLIKIRQRELKAEVERQRQGHAVRTETRRLLSKYELPLALSGVALTTLAIALSFAG